MSVVAAQFGPRPGDTATATLRGRVFETNKRLGLTRVQSDRLCDIHYNNTDDWLTGLAYAASVDDYGKRHHDVIEIIGLPTAKRLFKDLQTGNIDLNQFSGHQHPDAAGRAAYTRREMSE